MEGNARCTELADSIESRGPLASFELDPTGDPFAAAGAKRRTRAGGEGERLLSGAVQHGGTRPGGWLATPAKYAKRALVEEIRALLLREFDEVSVTEAVEDGARGRRVVLVDGWGALGLLDAVRHCRSSGAVTVALATDRRSDLAALLDAGADDAVVWPIAADELLARVRARSRSAREPEQGIRLDAANLALVSNSLVVPLTRDQVRILEALLLAPGRWITSRELLTGVFRSRQLDTTRVRRQMYRLRARLGADAWRLQSHRVRGYRFDVSARPSFVSEEQKNDYANDPKSNARVTQKNVRKGQGD